MKFPVKTWIVCAVGTAFLGTMPFAGIAQEVQTPDEPAVSAPGDPTSDLSVEARAFQGALAASVEGLSASARDAIVAFYAARDFVPYWLESDRAKALHAVLAEAGAQALPVARYEIDVAAPVAGDAAAEASFEVAAMRAFLRFAGDLKAGIVMPSAVDAEISRETSRPDEAVLLAALGERAIAEVIADHEPAQPDYRKLMGEKARLETLFAADAWGDAVPEGPLLEVGDRSSRVLALRSRLGRIGYEPKPDVTATPVASSPGADLRDVEEGLFDAELSARVKRFQADHGLNEDGAVGPRTLAAINTSIATRLEQVMVNLERMRWMNRDLGSRHIFVNIPDYTVSMIDNGETIYRTRSVVGEPEKTRTPEFSDVLSYFVVNPTWHLPDSIATRVYLPKLKQDPQVLAKNNMRLFTRSGTEIDPGLVDFTNVSASSFPFRIKQNPNADNALGRVKFMFPNQFAIYLHDTPARELFAKDARAFSNGCVRLEDPLELAYLLLDDQTDDPQARFDAWLAGKSERQVNLDTPIPVHIVYRTVWSEAAGEIQYRDDIYGRDAQVFDALEAEGVALPVAQG